VNSTGQRCGIDNLAFRLVVAVMLTLLSFVTLRADNHRAVQLPHLVLHLGQDPDGRPTEQWLDAVRHFNDDEAIRAFAATHQALTPEQTDWFTLISSRLGDWQSRTAELGRPFADVQPPSSVDVLLGNIGGEDAFNPSDKLIAFDLGRLQAVYGPARDPGNADRIDRFFAHEYTHVLHKIWRRDRGITIESPLEQALWGCLTEGLGNYRSLSGRWHRVDGRLSEHAEAVLARLSPILVERLAALRTATDREAAPLMRGLSMGPFEDKWGALPVALWLSEEVRRDDDALGRWVERGPWGVLDLAAIYLPPDLATKLPPNPNNSDE
jgi:hypothetical protein